MKTIKELMKKETVFCISFLLALVSSLAVTPDEAYLSYPDYRTLALLFCLMIIVAGFQSLGVFVLLGQFLLKRAGSLRNLPIIMVVLCFFSSMMITNDVTLITFVPFTLLVYQMIHREEQVLKLVVLETIAANLGSMATPIGNPQNLYLYSVSGITWMEFGRAVWPYAAVSLERTSLFQGKLWRNRRREEKESCGFPCCLFWLCSFCAFWLYSGFFLTCRC